MCYQGNLLSGWLLEESIQNNVATKNLKISEKDSEEYIHKRHKNSRKTPPLSFHYVQTNVGLNDLQTQKHCVGS